MIFLWDFWENTILFISSLFFWYFIGPFFVNYILSPPIFGALRKKETLIKLIGCPHVKVLTRPYCIAISISISYGLFPGELKTNFATWRCWVWKRPGKVLIGSWLINCTRHPLQWLPISNSRFESIRGKADERRREKLFSI